MTGNHIGIIGGGITGLALAWFLKERGAQVTVLERAPALGGLSASWDFGPFTWDRFYHVIAPGDQHMIDLVQAIGLGDDLRWTPTSQGIFMEGAIHPLRGPKDLLSLPRLSMIEKLRLGATAALARFSRAGDHLDQLSSAEWLAKRCGQGGYDKLWRYLLRAKLGEAAELVSARFIHATLQRLGKARGASGGGERFGTVRGGYARILDALVRKLEGQGVTCRANAVVEAVQQQGDRVHVGGPDLDTSFDKVCVTLPNTVLPDLIPALAGDRIGDGLRQTPYLGVACTAAVGKGALGKDYILNLCDDGYSITGVIETTQVVDPTTDLAGHGLVYLPRYDLRGSPTLEFDDDAVRSTALADLRRAHPHANDDWLVEASVHRAGLIQPLPMVGAPPVRPPRHLEGGRIHVVNNAQLDSCILNNNDCVGLAKDAAAGI